MISDNFFENVIKLVNHSKTALILTHANPDGDALGSGVAVYHYLLSKGIEPAIVFTTAIPENLKFILNDEKIISYDTETHSALFQNTDIIFILDLSDPERLREMAEPVLSSHAAKINIDHHLEPKQFADHYLVDSDASSSGELVWKLLKHDREYKIDRITASALYMAIMTDTGSFRFPKTDSEVHKIVSSLIEAGADPVELYEEIYNKMSLESTKLLGEAFAGLRTFYEGKLCLMHIKKDMFARTGAKEEDIENFVERLMTIKGVKVGILVTEVPDRHELRISFRSKENYSVRELATYFGGGGHFNAAGTRIKEFVHSESIIEAIITKVAEIFNFS